MTCNKREEDWEAYFRGRLDEREAALMEEHLASCLSCLAHFASWLHRNEEQLLLEHGPPADVTQRVLDAISAERRPQKKKEDPHSLWRMVWHYTLAACLALFLLNTGVFDQTLAYAQHSKHLFNALTAEWIQHSKEKSDHWKSHLDNEGLLYFKGGDTKDEK